MLRRIDRHIIRVPSLESAVNYYRDVLGMTLIRQDARVALFKLGDDDASELVIHADPDQPEDAIYYLVDDVRDIYNRRAELKLTFVSPPAQASRGYRAVVKDPFGHVLMLLDRTTESGATEAVEDAKSPGALFAGVEHKSPVKKDLLIQLYEKVGRTADDLPYTPHFESIYLPYISTAPDPKPTRAEVWRHLLTIRKAGNLPKLGEAKSRPPEVSADGRLRLRELLGEDIGKRDRLPYTERFDKIADEFNKTLPRPLAPHLIWRLIATLAK
jgi:catechol 2,3-dioxygenase-like lactoylglutathione lyase family enzyme